MMRKHIPVISLALVLVFGPANCLVAAVAQEGHDRIVVVVNRDNPVTSLSPLELQNIFLRKQQVWSDGTPITVYERTSEDPIRSIFAEQILRREVTQLPAYWLQLKMTQGIQAPKVCRSALLVKSYLLRVRGGIAYLYESEVDDHLKVVAVVESS